jgi:hypothetical protein
MVSCFIVYDCFILIYCLSLTFKRDYFEMKGDFLLNTHLLTIYSHVPIVFNNE